MKWDGSGQADSGSLACYLAKIVAVNSPVYTDATKTCAGTNWMNPQNSKVVDVGVN